MIAFAAAALAAPLPVGPTRLDVAVTGPVAELTVRRTFTNEAPGPVDAELWLAVPPDAVIDALTVTVGARRIESRVVARAEAQAAYEQAARAGQLATLLESHDADA